MNQRLHRAPLWRNTTSDCYCQGTNPPSRRPQLVFRGPSEGEEASKKLFAIGSVKRKLPSSPRHEENSACERAGVYGARAHRKLASAQLTRSSNAQHRTDFKSKRAQDRLGLCCSLCFCFRRPRVGTLCPQAGALPCKFRRSSHRPQAPAPLTRTTRRSQYLECLTQPRERLFPALSALSLPLALLPALLLQVRRCARSQLNTQQRAAHQPLRVL